MSSRVASGVISVSLPQGVLRELRDRVAPRQMSRFITEAVQHRLAMEGLAEIVSDREAAHGPVGEDALAAADRALTESVAAIAEPAAA